jgi:dihydroorotase
VTTTVLRSGRVIDPASGTDAVADVVVVDGVIRAMGPDAAPAYPDATDPDAVRIDCTGLIVTPGLVDLHTHVVPGLGDFCVHPDRAGVTTGVTTVIDAGTTGLATFGVSRARVTAPDVATRVRFLLDPCRLYLATKDFLPHRLHLADDPRNLDLDATAAALEEHADVVVGLKARACTVDDPTRSPFLEGAVAVAGPRPVMVHLGSFPYTPSLGTAATLDLLRGGDVVTHAFRGHSGAVTDEGTLLPALAEARARGVVLDLGHSGADFRFAAARRLFELGVLPDTLSTDINLFNESGPVHSLVEVMSKMLALGLPLAAVVAMVTVRPARVVHLEDELGALGPGREADVTVLRLEQGDFELSDGFERVRVPERLVPVGCLRAGAWHDASPYAVSPLPEPVAA